MPAARHATTRRKPIFIALSFLLTAAQTLSTAASPQQTFLARLVAAAHERLTHTVRYDAAYVRIPFPNGDLPAGTGVCTDEIIRIYRAVGIDLQKLVHDDMQQNRAAYPNIGKPGATDTNIDHRRVPNLMASFARHGKSLPISNRAEDYSPGDLVTWNLGGNITHIGIVVDTLSPNSPRHMIVHNFGRGPQMEDVLFSWKIIGHYRYFGRNP